mgnify:CR=1 FL=1
MVDLVLNRLTRAGSRRGPHVVRQRRHDFVECLLRSGEVGDQVPELHRLLLNAGTAALVSIDGFRYPN